MYCQKCGAQLDADAQFCKSCGTAIRTTPQPYAPVYQQPAKQTNNLALFGLILSFVMPIGGLVVSIIARKQCIERGEDGEKLAKAGIVAGAIYCALLAVMIIALVVLQLVLFTKTRAPIVPALPYY